MDEFLTWMVEENKDITEIMGAAFFKAAEMENKFVVPTEFTAFSTIRSKTGEITHIHDDKNHAIAGSDLREVLVYSAMRDKGFKAIILGPSDAEALEVLAIPKGIMIEGASDVKGKKDFHNNVRMLYTHKASTTVYASPENIMGILKLDYVTLPEVNNLTKALNALAAKEDLSAFDADALINIADLHTALTDQEAKASRKHFYQTLYAAKIRKTGIEDRLELFKASPSYTLANNLEFRLPHSGPCYSKLGNKPIIAVPLESVSPGADILMATNIMSQKDYKEIAGDVSKYLVYVNSDDLGGRKGNKWASMSYKVLEKAEHVRAYLSTISTANTSGGNASASDASGPQTGGFNLIKLN
jgi:hypothetical protein